MTEWRLTTPVTFIIFNRPDTAARVFAEIRRARPQQLLVIADGPRHHKPGEAEQCAATRRIIDGVDWPCQVLTNYSATNLGCKTRLSSGLNWVFETVEESIILEDDCLPHPSFFRFCEEILQRYRNDERVMMVGGTNYLQDVLQAKESYFFSRYFPIWGWASWRRAWQHYDLGMAEWPRLKKEGQLHGFYSQRFMRRMVTSMFDEAQRGEIDTWDIQWFYTCLFNNGLCAVPRVNLISNIGLEGTHTTGNTTYNCLPVFPLESEALVHPGLVYPHNGYDNEFFKRYEKVALAMKFSHALKLLRKPFGL